MAKSNGVLTNDVLQDQAGRYWSVIRIHKPFAWIIQLKRLGSKPVRVHWDDVAAGKHGAIVPYAYPGLNIKNPPEKAWKDATRKYDAIEGLLGKGLKIFDVNERKRILTEHAKEVGHSVTSLYKWLNMYWTGGQSKYAMLHASYLRPSRRKCGVTAKRGRKSRRGVPTYQMREEDQAEMLVWLKKDYLTKKERKLSDSYKRYLHAHWRTKDDCDVWVEEPEGKRPSYHQFRSVLERHFSMVIRQTLRLGKKRARAQFNPVLGSVEENAVGVGHTYEIDATILDLWIQSRRNRMFSVGKATLYLIIDRVSRLIVGFYMCLYKPSWDGAVQAILSIAEDKEEMCRRYGVKYDPNDWPAHEVFPERFFGDRGEMFSENSNRIPHIEIRVTNPPSWTPQAKPVVESRFKLIHSGLAASTPGHQPPLEAVLRGGKRYEQDGCLNIDEATAVILGLIIRHNKTVIKRGRITQANIDGVLPVPLKLWNHGIETTTGLLRRFSYDHVWRHLMPSSTGTTTTEGLVFKDLHYTCRLAVERGWFTKGAVAKEVKVTYNSRLVDKIWIHHDGELIEAILVKPEQFFRGFSFCEAQVTIQKLHDLIAEHDANESLHEQFVYEDLVQAIVTPAKAAKKVAGKAPKRVTAANTKVARTLDNRQLAQEAEERRVASSRPNASPPTESATPQNVVAFKSPRRSARPAAKNVAPAAAAVPLDLLDKALQDNSSNWL